MFRPGQQELIVGASAARAYHLRKLSYAAVSARTHEIATLRAIGYQPLPVAQAHRAY